jgi:hypothetical protein
VGTHGEAGEAIYDNITLRMRFACRITKATDTHSECAILVAFARQQRLRERALILRLYIHFRFSFVVVLSLGIV